MRCEKLSCRVDGLAPLLEAYVDGYSCKYRCPICHTWYDPEKMSMAPIPSEEEELNNDI